MVDMMFDDETQDLRVDNYGGLLYHTAEDVPANAVVRRLGTPTPGYARMIRVGQTVEVYNSSYASGLTSLLSTTSLSSTDIQSAVELASAQDGRITPIDFAINEQSGSVHSFTLSYLTNDTVQSITASL